MQCGPLCTKVLDDFSHQSQRQLIVYKRSHTFERGKLFVDADALSHVGRPIRLSQLPLQPIGYDFVLPLHLLQFLSRFFVLCKGRLQLAIPL